MYAKNYKPKPAEFYDISIENKLKKQKEASRCVNKEIKEIYHGNFLDSSHPQRSTGKYRDIPKQRRLSKLKNDIVTHEGNRTSDAEVIQYCDNLVNNDLNEATVIFLKKILKFQENAFKKNSSKASIKKRYIAGIHETEKYLVTKKVKLLIIAADLRIYSVDELLYSDIQKLKYLAKENEIPCIFALKRSKLGNLLKKHRPVSCIGILNYQSAETELNNVLMNYTEIYEENQPEENASDYELLKRLKDTVVDCDKQDQQE